ncbi:hypothetical protein LTR08_006652 [Meristemomyces frigidus]|nr:hypothetical protein LTR08_006652 [Meristemomyces frigidus]
MECNWDHALIQLGQRLPVELLQVIQQTNTAHSQYIEAFTDASLDARYTHLLFVHGENIFAHICASLRDRGSLAAALATLGRIVPFAPYLTPFATSLLAKEPYEFSSSRDQDDDLLYLLGLLRLLRTDRKTFTQYVDLVQIRSLLDSFSRPVVYVAIRVLQICLEGADHWFEETIKACLGEDSPNSNICGQWDDRTIDYRFLSLWEEQRYGEVQGLLEAARSTIVQSTGHTRVLPTACFHPSTAMVGNVLLPRASPAQIVQDQAGNSLVATMTVANNLQRIATGLKSEQPMLLTGLAGSGKTLLIRHVAQKLGKLEQMVTLHLNEQSDAKLLIGLYTTGDTPGSFVWRPGVLTTAVREGRWVLIEDLDRAPNEIIGALLPLIERRELLLPSQKQTIHAAPGFRIIATVRSMVNHRGEETRPLAHMLGARHWQSTTVAMPTTVEQSRIALQLFPSLAQLLPQFMGVYERLQASRERAALVGQSRTGVLRPINPRDLLKWCGRVSRLLQTRTVFTSADLDDIFMEAIDCFVGALPDGTARESMVAVIAEELHIDPRRRDYLLSERDVRYELEKSKITVGRYSMLRAQQSKTLSAGQGTFSTNPHTSRMLERVAAAIINHEPLLLVGETGVGKTTAVQHLAGHLGKKLQPFNLSQQSEAGDLLGGFKPVTARSLMVPMQDEFDDLFRASFSIGKNQQFLELLGKQMSKSNWKAVVKLWQQALKMVDQQRSVSPPREGEAPNKKRKVESISSPNFARWEAFAAKATDIGHRLAAGNEAFAFSFVEGNIVKAVRNGDWVLLDEINLASPDTMEAIADLLDPGVPSLLLTESGNVARIEAHRDFRVFAAMNPATDVGKKDLPPGIRSRFTELYVESPDKDIKSLQSIVRSYLRTETAADPAIALDISKLYQHILRLSEESKLVDGAGLKPHFSLRTLTRTLTFAKSITPQCSMRRALYEGFQMSFLTFLDVESTQLVLPMLEQHLLGKRMNIKAELHKSLRRPNDGHGYVQGFPGSKHWVRQGKEEPQEEPHYILTPFIKTNLENLARAASTRQFPVLIQGPTSSGKTSMIEYLAKRTGHAFVRINNHEHTDLQEYLGTYVSGADGKLSYQEGILVRALREGHWVVLDELNLAPTDVLEALNRLLDDNRELLIPETQEVVRPHADFMLFATQNPAGLYGGRKVLSRAFRNRFLELHFDDIPIDELQEILHKRTQLPESRCKRIVTVYKELSALRQENRLFEQKSFATLRDLFRWALRSSDDIEQLAANGFMLLAERVRKPEERRALKDVIERVFSTKGPRVTIDESVLYSENDPAIRAHLLSATSQGVVWTKAMRRLYVLVSRAIQNNEPVLLVGETGCGKTTVCQMLADALRQNLHTVNAHQNTETGDLIGSQRPVRNRAAIEAKLRDLLLASPPLRTPDDAAAQLTDALLDVYDRAVKSLQQSEKQAYCTSQVHHDIQATRTRFMALFEWTDGNLIQAMKEGAFFLMDEISLADDSVLERINSVLESQRSILLAEKGSLDSFVTAAPGFQFFATMNPGGDYGKRELSPALRNRFTEVWVPALSDTEDIVQIVSAKLAKDARGFSDAIVAFAQWFRVKYNTSASSSISVRDALAWVDFVNTFPGTDIITAIVHGAALVYIDTLGANPAGLMTLTGRNLDEERTLCLHELGRILEADATIPYSASPSVEKNEYLFTVGSFSIPSRTGAKGLPQGFTFEAETTRRNAMRVVRAMQLPKPVMLEGSPGVGKTAMVTAIAAAAGAPLTRINLSEQTDLLDLFGSDVPVEGAATGTFAWRDAPFLRAMKSGEWVLLDEMNLASQSVLEGLNACLDHRGEVYVPELGQTFSKHPQFRLFAAQNPHHQGGGRKGLPASFVNRFTVVYADAFRSEDLMLICRRSFPQLNAATMERAVSFVAKLDSEVAQYRRFGANGGPWEFNLRDISRWLALETSDHGLLPAGNSRDFVEFLFSQRFRSAADRASASELFSSIFQDTPSASDLFCSMSPLTMQIGVATLPRSSTQMDPIDGYGLPALPREHLRILESVMLCVQQRWPVVLAGPAGAGKTSLLQLLASATGASLVTISMSADTDAMDLIGGYEQSDPFRQGLQALNDLQVLLVHKLKTEILDATSSQAMELLLSLQRRTAGRLPDTETLRHFAAVLGRIQMPALDDLLATVESCSVAIDKARFEWTDGLLIDALRQGKWLVLDNANLCSSSVLDRLNSLLEPNGTLIINEHAEHDGAPRIVEPHPNFRVFLVVDPRYGELSRAMRNRAVELYMPAVETSTGLGNALTTESAMARFRQMRSISGHAIGCDAPEERLSVLRDHTGLRDQPLLAALTEQIQAGLYGGRSAWSDNPDSVGVHAFVASAPLQDFYQTAASRAHTSADFACVQTIHPLNNQALVQQSHEIFLQASTLALTHDTVTQLAPLAEGLSVARSDQTVMRQLERTERSQVSKQNRAGPGILSHMEQIVQLTMQWTQQLAPMPLMELAAVKVNLHRICSYLGHFSYIMDAGSLDSALLSAWLSAFHDTARGASTGAASPLNTLLVPVQEALTGLVGNGNSKTGRACALMWQKFKPVTPQTMAQLSSLLGLEELVDRFDHMCWQYDQPLATFVGLRLAFLRALTTTSASASDITTLTHKLESLVPDGEEAPFEETPLQRPHFARLFENFCQRFASLQFGTPSLPLDELLALELFASRPTQNSIGLVAMKSSPSVVQTDFHLLRCALSYSDPSDATLQTSSVPLLLLQSAASSGEVKLANLETLKSEIKTVGHTVSANAHLLSQDTLPALDACLERLLTAVLSTLMSELRDLELRDMAVGLMSALKATGHGTESAALADVSATLRDHHESPDLSWMRAQLQVVIAYLREDITEQSRLQHAALAWAAFALVCLMLYIPETPFDPALIPRIQRDVHRQCLTSLSAQLQALRHLRTATTGTPDSLRARVLQTDLDNFGPEPRVEEICRPEKSEMTQLQGEFNSLIRAVQPLHQSVSAHLSSPSEDAVAWSNIDRIGQRLIRNYRAYADLTAPTTGFIDCLRMSRNLAGLAELQGQQNEVMATVENITPFVKASINTWLTEKRFLLALSSGADQLQTLYVLSVLAARCSVQPLIECSPALREAVNHTFMRFYQQWRVKLSDDQRRTAANSSLYRFKGGDDAEDDVSTEELDELFPGRAEDTTNTSIAAPKQKQDHDLALRLTRLHHAIFAKSQLTLDSLWENLQQFNDLASTSEAYGNDQAYVPAMICSLQGLTSQLSGSANSDQAYNMYTDANPQQVRSLSLVLANIRRRFEALHTAWPEHATPVDVLRACRQVLDISHAEPLTSFLPHLERLHATVSEWQKIASREYSASEVLEALTSLIVSWRQLELSSWAGLLKRETANCEQAASSWWYIAHENIIVASVSLRHAPTELSQHAEGLLKTLEGFMASCGLGEYLPRLNMLKDFTAQIAAYAKEDSTLMVVGQALSNFVAYYQHFVPLALEKLTKGRDALEKAIKNVIQLASWKDRNVETLKQSAKSSHMKLLRLVRKYRTLLAQSVAPILQAGIPQSQPIGETAVEPTNPSHIEMLGANTDRVASSQVSTWQSRPTRFINISATVALMQAKAKSANGQINAPERIAAFAAELTAAIAELQKATPTRLTEENKPVVKHLKTRKRRMLADVLKDVRNMGFRSNLGGDILAQQDSLHVVLAKIPAIDRTSEWQVVDAVDHSLHRLLDLMPTVREGSRKHSEDLTPGEVARCLALLESMLHVSIGQRTDIYKHLQSDRHLQVTLDQMIAFASCAEPAVGVDHQAHRLLAARTKGLAAALETCVRLLESQSALATRECPVVVQQIQRQAAKLTKLHESVQSLPKLPTGLRSSGTVSLETQFECIVTEVEASIAEATLQEPDLEPVLSHVSRWSRFAGDVLGSETANGYAAVDPSTWVSDLLQTLDHMLGAMQELEPIPSTKLEESNDKAWVVTQSLQLDRHLNLLRLDQIHGRVETLLHALPHLTHATDDSLPCLASICQTILPVVNTFTVAYRQLLKKLCVFHVDLNKTAFRLATAFVQLAQQGFCSPSEKPPNQDQKEGEVESGTGLGDGEGGEDISKDVGDDEDLSELAQEAKAGAQKEDIEDEKDAVDMADEEMEGELGDGPEESQDENGDADDAGEPEGQMDEEAGEVDDLGPAVVDEKMWDEGESDERTDKEADNAKGTSDDQEIAAGKQDQRNEPKTEEGDEADDDALDAEAGADETEEVEHQAPETMDPHAEDQQKLDLPDDIAMDDDKAPADDADSDGVSDIEANEQQDAAEDGDEKDLGSGAEEREDDTDDDSDEISVDENLPGERAAGEEPEDENDDAMSDVLMQDDQNPVGEERPDDAVVGESGTGADEDESKGSRPEAAAAAQQEEDQEGAPEQEQQPDAGASGQQRGTRAEDANASSDQGPDEQSRSQYKQIGDVLEEWYRQHRQIESAKQEEPAADRAQDINMAEASFEHLPDEQTEADTQALGTASAEQSKALDEENGLPVNDKLDAEHQPDDELLDDRHPEDDQALEDHAQMEPMDALRQDDNSNAFVGEPVEADADTEMVDDLTASEEDEVSDVDQQLNDTHLDIQDDADTMSIEEARRSWSDHEASTRNLALVLTEHLRLILQPTQATKMRGDFRTGKRLNIKRIIPYIASSYKRDKIWMRRSVPSKRAYQIMLAIDDSKSMAESESRDLAFETLALVAKSMSMLEVGELSVVRFGGDVSVAHDFSTPFTSDAGADVFRQFTFAQSKTDVRKLLAESIELFRAARLKAAGSASDLWQLQLIISDGVCEDHPTIRQLVRTAHEERIMVVFIVVDATAQKAEAAGGPRQSILDLQTAKFVKDAAGESQLSIVKYLDTFPFRYYLIVRDVQELPGVLAGALRQWFAEVVESGG